MIEDSIPPLLLQTITTTPIFLGLEACLQRFPIQYFREGLKSCQLITFKLMKESLVLVEGTRGSFH